MVHPKSRQLIFIICLTILIVVAMTLLTMMTQLSLSRDHDVVRLTLSNLIIHS